MSDVPSVKRGSSWRDAARAGSRIFGKAMKAARLGDRKSAGDLSAMAFETGTRNIESDNVKLRRALRSCVEAGLEIN